MVRRGRTTENWAARLTVKLFERKTGIRENTSILFFKTKRRLMFVI